MITTVTSVTSTVGAAMGYGLGILATVLLIGLLVAKELSGAAAASYGSSRNVSYAASLDRVLNVAVIPLLITFAVIVTDKVLRILR